MYKSTALNVFLALAAVSAAHASIVSTTGQVTVLSSAPASVAQGGLQSNTTAYLFQENQLVLPTTVDTDISTPGTYRTVDSLTSGTVAAGTDVDVYMLETQPSSVPTNPGYQTYEGSVTFSTPILGIIVETDSLRSTDALLGAPGATYPSLSDAYSGLDLNTAGCTGSNCGNDVISLSANDETIYFGLATNYSEDEIRVITAATPEPRALFLALALVSLLALKSVRVWKRKQESAGLRRNNEALITITNCGTFRGGQPFCRLHHSFGSVK